MWPAPSLRLAIGVAVTLAVAAAAGRAAAEEPARPTEAAAAPAAERATPEAAAAAPVSAADLQMPATGYPDIAEVMTRVVSVDDPATPDSAASGDLLALRRSGQSSAGNFRYRLGGERPGRLKVRVDVFRDEATAATQFRGRHMPEALALTEPLLVGDDGFLYGQEYAGFRVGPVVVEIRASEGAGHLAPFARAYAEFVAATLAAATPAAAPADDSRR